jgi:hypothetical protein
MESPLVEDPGDARAFVEVPRTERGRVILKVGGDRLELNRWGTVLVSALVAGSPMLRKAVKVLRPRRMKRPAPPTRSGRSLESSTPLSTAVVAPPLGEEASVETRAVGKPSKAMRRAQKRVRKHASGPILVAPDAEEARRFLTHALATPEPVIAEYRDREVVFTPDGSKAVLALFAASRYRLNLAHIILKADAFRPDKATPPKTAAPPKIYPAGQAEASDPWGPEFE